VAKEFRYLRILKVRTVVYEQLAPPPKRQRFLDSYRTNVSLYTSSCEFAETCVFSKQSLWPISCPRSPFPAAVPPSPEVTGSICRVPLRGFPHRPSCSCTSVPVLDSYEFS